MRGNRLGDGIENECTHKKLDAILNDDKMMENQLRWFGHVKWMFISTPVRQRRSNRTTRTIGRHKMNMDEAMNKDMIVVNLIEMALSTNLSPP